MAHISAFCPWLWSQINFEFLFPFSCPQNLAQKREEQPNQAFPEDTAAAASSSSSNRQRGAHCKKSSLFFPQPPYQVGFWHGRHTCDVAILIGKCDKFIITYFFIGASVLYLKSFWFSSSPILVPRPWGAWRSPTCRRWTSTGRCSRSPGPPTRPTRRYSQSTFEETFNTFYES